MGLPNIIIEFKTKADTAIKRGMRGVVAVLAIGEGKEIKATKLKTLLDIPETLTAEEKEHVKRAFKGGSESVNFVWLITSDTLANALNVAETVKFDYLTAHYNVTEEEALTVAAFIKGLYDDKKIKSKAVLPNIKGDHEAIINFTTENIVADGKNYTASQYCSRIAGILAGTPLTISSTYFVLPEVSDVPKFTRTELDKKIDNGEFVLFHDGEKVKVGRGVNSLTTVTDKKTEDYKYIKIIDAMDFIYNDVIKAIEDNYIGKFPNNYDNKCILLVVVDNYLKAMEDEGILQDVKTSIDLEAQKKYLVSHGVDISDMSETEIKNAKTGTFVFLKASFKIVNAIEDVTVNFYI